MIDKKTVENDGGILRWEHETDYGFRYELTLYASCNYLEFGVTRLSDRKKVFGMHKEYKQWEQAVKMFDKTKADILDPDNPAHASMQSNAAKYYPETETYPSDWKTTKL